MDTIQMDTTTSTTTFTTISKHADTSSDPLKHKLTALERALDTIDQAVTLQNRYASFCNISLVLAIIAACTGGQLSAGILYTYIGVRMIMMIWNASDIIGVNDKLDQQNKNMKAIMRTWSTPATNADH